MWRLICAVCVLVSVVGCQGVTTERAPPAYRLVDLSDDFVSFYDDTTDMGSSERITAFKAEISPLFPGFYNAERMAQQLRPFDDRIARSFTRFPGLRERYVRIASNFNRMIRPALGEFTRRFPDMGNIGDIYLLHSLGEMDGGMREIGGQIFLIFGADGMAQHTFDDETPFFHHELFHRYHFKNFPGCERVWCQLWIEGLATYVAHELNPRASDDQLLLTFPEPIRPQFEANRVEAICAVRSRFDTDQDFGALFSTDRLNERLPPRFGYYVGYLVAREAARTRSLQDLAQLTVTDAQPVVDAALAALADCPKT